MDGGRIGGGVGGEGRQEEETPKDEVDALGWKKKKGERSWKREADEAVWRKTVTLCLMGVNIIDIKHQLDAWRL